MRYFYCHPESECIWMTYKRTKQYDGCVEEIDKVDFIRLRKLGWKPYYEAMPAGVKSPEEKGLIELL